MYFSGSSAMGITAGGVGTAYTASRSDILGRRYAPFSNPFFDQASTYLPSSIKSLFNFCRYYYLSHSVINAVITRASEYAITDIIFEHPSKNVVSRWEGLFFEDLNYRVHQFECNLDLHTYGNSFVSPSFPFRKVLKCDSCNAEVQASNNTDAWRYTNFKFWLTCPKCGQQGYAKSSDKPEMRISEINLIRWNPEEVMLFHNEATGRIDYAINISTSLRNDIQIGRKEVVANTPEIFLEAVKEKKMLVVDKKSMFHLRRPSLSGHDIGWGIPLLLPVLKDAFYMQIMKRAQEVVLLTYILPQILLFPQPATSGADPYSTVSLQDWKAQVQRELARQRMDPAYYAIMPFPVGHQVIGEPGKNLLLMPEIRAMAEQIVVGMGFPIDLVFGQGTYAGSSVNMRMLENFFLSNMIAHKTLLKWTIRRMGTFLGWQEPTARFKPFRMADDLQRQAFSFQLNQAGKISDTTLLSMADLNFDVETGVQISEMARKAEVLRKQQLAMADAQGEAGVVQAKYQNKAQQLMAEAQAKAQQQSAGGAPFVPPQQSGLAQATPGVGMDQALGAMAAQVRSLPPAAAQQQLEMLASSNPEMAQALQAQLGAGAQPTGVDMRPAPEKLPPRRAA